MIDTGFVLVIFCSISLIPINHPGKFAYAIVSLGGDISPALLSKIPIYYDFNYFARKNFVTKIVNIQISTKCYKFFCQISVKFFPDFFRSLQVIIAVLFILFISVVLKYQINLDENQNINSIILNCVQIIKSKLSPNY